mmetsp:Transcript_28893/g.43764  ORF Transcript_28893/g.43764 Transcript_28893/m.43764 type:complete len:250 (-) Transcript_28893:5-754(-)
MGHWLKIALLEGDLETVLHVDELARALHGDFRGLVKNALGTFFCRHSTFLVPDGRVLLSHRCSVEARVQHHDWHFHRLQFLGHEHCAHVASRSAHVVAIVATLVLVLCEAPLCGASLAGNDDDLGLLVEESSGLHRPHTAEGPQGLDLILLQSCLVLDGVEIVLDVREVACDEEDVVHRFRNGRAHLLHGVIAGDINILDNLARCLLELRHVLSRRRDDHGFLLLQLLHKFQSDTLAGTNHQDALALVD